MMSRNIFSVSSPSKILSLELVKRQNLWCVIGMKYCCKIKRYYNFIVLKISPALFQEEFQCLEKITWSLNIRYLQQNSYKVKFTFSENWQRNLIYFTTLSPMKHDLLDRDRRRKNIFHKSLIRNYLFRHRCAKFKNLQQFMRLYAHN